MKQIIFNGIETTMFFNNHANIESICEWIQNKVIFDEIEGFRLNESISCKVSIINEKEFIIKGDEDLISCEIINVKPIF